MWYKVRAYRCAICGRVDHGRENPDGGHLLPDGWSGSVRRCGACFCNACRESITGGRRV